MLNAFDTLLFYGARKTRWVMMFDALCGMVERYPHLFPDNFNNLLRQVKLFHWEGRPHELPTEALEGNIPGKLGEEFFLPFPLIAVEDTWSVVILMDPGRDTKGIVVPRFFIECASETDERVMELRPDLRPDEAEMKLRRECPRGTVSIKWGEFSKLQLNDDGTFYAESGVMGYVIGNREAIRESELPSGANDYRLLAQESTNNVYAALRELALINTPQHLVMKVQRVNGGKKTDPQRSPKIPRSSDRPFYRLVTVSEARRMMGLPEMAEERNGEDGKREVKARRGHPRFLKAPCFKNKRGWIRVRPVWKDATVAVRGKTRYEVLLTV